MRKIYKSEEMRNSISLIKANLNSLLKKEKIHLNFYYGTGRNTKKSTDYVEILSQQLQMLLGSYTDLIASNDAVRGGFCGDFVQLKRISNFKKKLASFEKKIAKQEKKDEIQKKIDKKEAKNNKKIQEEQNKIDFENQLAKIEEEKMFWNKIRKEISSLDLDNLEKVKQNKKFIYNLYKTNKDSSFVGGLHQFLKELNFSREAKNIMFEKK